MDPTSTKNNQYFAQVFTMLNDGLVIGIYTDL